MKKTIFLILAQAMAIMPGMSQRQTPRLEDWLTGQYRPNYVYGIQSTNDGEHFTTTSRTSINKFDYKTGNQVATYRLSHWPDGYQFSPDETKILYHTNEQPIYRRSFFAKYYVYDTITKLSTPICEGDNQRIASISPDNQMVAYILDNNIYIYHIATGQTQAVTTDGEFNKIINGAPDWVYEEEFSFNQAYAFSPDSKYIAYIKFNEERVKSYTLQFYSPLADKYESEANYPTNYTYKYPKVGEENSIVSVHIFNIATGETITADLGKDTDIYVPNIKWIEGPNVLAITRINRLQNTMELLSLNPADKSTKKFFTLRDPKYIEEDVCQSVTYINGGKSFIITTEQGGYRNIQHYGMDGKLINNVTSGSKEVIELKGYDPKTKTVYYTAVGSNSTQVSVYSSSIDGKKRRLISPAIGTSEPEFSKNYKYFINRYTDANTPYQFTLHDNSGKAIRVLEDNRQYQQKIMRLGGPNKEFFTWKNSSGTDLNGFMIKPYDFDSTRQYPVLVVGYNGPNHCEVNDEFSFDWHNALAAKGYIIACTDTRGTGRKGSDFRKCTYGQLGNLETRDLVDFAKYLSSQKYIDGSRLGIWGWSYGGFMVSNAMTRGAGNYKVGIAIAPVESWEYYDNIYTERYMGMPDQNAAGYKDNSPIKYARNLEGKLLLIYGSADDNVHPQNAMVFCEALVQANKDFDMMQYTNKNHSIYGGNTRRHLYNKIFNYILENL